MKVNIGKFFKKADRRINIQIDKYDTWNLDHTLALIIYPALIQLKQDKHGVPGCFADVGGDHTGIQDSFVFYKETHDESFDAACKQWDEVLDKMIWAFQQLTLDDYTTKYSHGDPKFDFVKTDKTHLNPITGKIEELVELVDQNPGQHWVDYEGIQEHERRIQEGLNLFSRHYRSLWD